MTHTVQHDAAGHSFDARIDGHRAVLDYRLDRGVMEIVHTGVPAAVGGRGIAAALTRAALEHARARGWKVRPLCSYASAYLKRHPQFADLLAQ